MSAESSHGSSSPPPKANGRPHATSSCGLASTRGGAPSSLTGSVGSDQGSGAVVGVRLHAPPPAESGHGSSPPTVVRAGLASSGESAGSCLMASVGYEQFLLPSEAPDFTGADPPHGAGSSAGICTIGPGRASSVGWKRR
jgi:hypothetical protein